MTNEYACFFDSADHRRLEDMSQPPAMPSLELCLLLRAARETGALEALMTTAETPTDLASETDLSERAAETLVDVLEAEGFLEDVVGAYEPTNRSLGFLAKADVRSIGSLPTTLDRLDRGLETDWLLTDDRPTETDTERRNRLGRAAAADEATTRALVTAAIRVAPEARRVLEVGGAPGRRAVEFARRGVDVTLYGDPEAVTDSRAILAGEPVAVLEGAVVDGFDLIVAVDQLSCLGPAANETLVDAAADALEPGGWLVVAERLEGPPATRVAVETLLETTAGRVYPTDRYREWFERAGLERWTVESVPGTAYVVLAGRRSLA
ncbi:class I SAM-dependent methyltransferase [Natronosalvus rutilus]|uniref:Class I SAM-dependent methyltransferase n=1 Tax=Natronosalvus rutilus TaxID=2953753 RepID=A0A9E7ND13_9EURY|nr:methyltransferase domain-containing protein [Natronosalvus rutilus]UTF54694.1 class I SAM-dependent methyltransferase [Natronosalvus rutilus]